MHDSVAIDQYDGYGHDSDSRTGYNSLVAIIARDAKVFNLNNARCIQILHFPQHLEFTYCYFRITFVDYVYH